MNSGTLSLSSSSSSTVGSAAKDVTIAPAIHDVGTLNIGAGVSLTAGNLFVGSVDNVATAGGAGTLNQTGGSVAATSVFLGGVGTALNPARGVLNLSGGALTTSAVTTGGGTAAAVNFNGGTFAQPRGAILQTLSTLISRQLSKRAERTSIRMETRFPFRITLYMTQPAPRLMADLTNPVPVH